MELHHEDNPNEVFTDLDIICICDGQFIIGECKNNSNDFLRNKDQLLQFAELAQWLHPDVIILSCYNGTKEKMKEAIQLLQEQFTEEMYEPTIIEYIVAEES